VWFLIIYRDPPRHAHPRPPRWSWGVFAIALAILVLAAYLAGLIPR
jgi:hypothetical protein